MQLKRDIAFEIATRLLRGALAALQAIRRVRCRLGRAPGASLVVSLGLTAFCDVL